MGKKGGAVLHKCHSYLNRALCGKSLRRQAGRIQPTSVTPLMMSLN